MNALCASAPPLPPLQMQDDVYWYPLFLQGRSFRGTFRFKDTHTLVEHELQEVEAL